MLKRISLRWRLTILTTLLMALCCICLSLVLSVSAYRMANTIEAIPVQPAYSIGDLPLEETMPPILPATSSDVAQQARGDYGYESLFFTLVAMVIGGCLTYYVAGKALEPVKAFNKQVKNIHVHNLKETIEVPPTGDEIAELAASFNDMTEKLDRAFSIQKRFSADAAHELRTPLAVMQTKLDVFRKKGQHTPEEYEALTAAFQKQLGRLRSLVTELLDMANMEGEWTAAQVPLLELLEEVQTDLSSVAEGKTVSITLSGGEAYAWGNPELLYRAFYNLVENGIKYNVPGGRVAIEIQQGKDQVMVSVSDTGPGIPQAMREQVFEPFFRVDKSRSREMGGAGLGLSMVDAIVRQHGGTVSLADCQGGGSCFTVTLPIHP